MYWDTSHIGCRRLLLNSGTEAQLKATSPSFPNFKTQHHTSVRLMMDQAMLICIHRNEYRQLGGKIPLRSDCNVNALTSQRQSFS